MKHLNKFTEMEEKIVETHIANVNEATAEEDVLIKAPTPIAGWNGKADDISMGKINGKELIYSIRSQTMWGNGVAGTIRVAPQNYYVATVELDGSLKWQNMEGMTKDLRMNKRAEIEQLYQKVKKK
jgi:hypothetical protein